MSGARSVVVLDDDVDLCDAIRDLFTFLGARCLTFPSLAAMQQAERDVLACDVAILDVNLGAERPSGIDAHQWLRARGFRGRIVFLTGHARTHPEVARAPALGVDVLQKPIESSALRALIER